MNQRWFISPTNHRLCSNSRQIIYINHLLIMRSSLTQALSSYPLLWIFLLLFFGFNPSSHAQSAQVFALSNNDLQFDDCPQQAPRLIAIDTQQLPDPSAQQIAIFRQADALLLLNMKADDAKQTQRLWAKRLHWHASKFKQSQAHHRRSNALIYRTSAFKVLGAFNQTKNHGKNALWLILARVNSDSFVLATTLHGLWNTKSLLTQQFSLLKERQRVLLLGASVHLPSSFRQRASQTNLSLYTKQMDTCQDEYSIATKGWLSIRLTAPPIHFK